jgi:peptide/nickel transport system ATP-binding protein
VVRRGEHLVLRPLLDHLAAAHHHDLATVRAIADEVVVMRRGKVVEQGPKDEMFKPPHHPYTDLLLSSVPEMDPNWLSTVLEERGVDNVGEAANI